MRFEFFLGLRYLKAKRKQAFISVITIISVTGVMVGVMALIVVLSVMNGFTADLMSKILGVNSHLLVRSYGGAFGDYEEVAARVERTEGVVATTPFIYSQVMLNASGYAAGAVLRGLDTRTAGEVIAIESMIRGGDLPSLDSPQDGLPGIILGKELSKQLGLAPGDAVTVISPQGKLTPMGRVPNSKDYRVTALFDSGMYEYDASMAYIGLEEAQGFLGLSSRVSGIEVKVSDIDHADRIGAVVAKALGYPYWTQDWKQMNRTLVSALRLEKIAMFVILIMIVLVGALNIISTLVMVVMEKTRDIAILRAMGATSKNIMTVFVFQGLLVGVVGTLAGLLAGLGLCQILATTQFIQLPADVYYISTLPVDVDLLDVFFVTLAAVGTSFMATIYPAWRASRMDPAEALRYE